MSRIPSTLFVVMLLAILVYSASKMVSRFEAGKSESRRVANGPVEMKTNQPEVGESHSDSPAKALAAISKAPSKSEINSPPKVQPSPPPPFVSLENRKIKEIFPELNSIDPKEFLGRLAVTDFPENGATEFVGGDDQFQTYKFKSKNNEDVEKWFWTEDGTVAVEQVNYSPDEKVIRRYYDHSNSVSEVSYEYGPKGGILRFRDDGSVESYQVWNGQGRNTANNTLIRYNEYGQPVERWRLVGDDWTQEF